MSDLASDPEAQLIPERAYKACPPEERVFDDKLLSAAGLMVTAGAWPVRVQVDERGTVLACVQCEGMIEPVISRQGHSYQLRLVQTLANTLRHMVMTHDFALSGGSTTGG